MKQATLCLAFLLSALPVFAAPPPQVSGKAARRPKPKKPLLITTESGLKYVDTLIGTGAAPVQGQRCLVHYTGWLADGRGQRGKKFDSSVDRGQPLAIPIGVGRVIKGWDEGLSTMRVGGKRTLYIPSHLGYGTKGAGGDIPPNADLIFDVELLGIQ